MARFPALPRRPDPGTPRAGLHRPARSRLEPTALRAPQRRRQRDRHRTTLRCHEAGRESTRRVLRRPRVRGTDTARRRCAVRVVAITDKGRDARRAGDRDRRRGRGPARRTAGPRRAPSLAQRHRRASSTCTSTTRPRSSRSRPRCRRLGTEQRVQDEAASHRGRAAPTCPRGSPRRTRSPPRPSGPRAPRRSEGAPVGGRLRFRRASPRRGRSRASTD